MNPLEFPSLGQTWINLVYQTVQTGTAMGNEGRELLGVSVGFPAAGEAEPILDQFGDPEMIAEMKKVFFAQGPNALGHSYAGSSQGPGGRSDLEDVISMLRAEPWTKRAVLSLCGPPGGHVPCVNSIQFLVRNAEVRTFYFARGQDAFRKFYADGLCLGLMGQKVAGKLGLRPGTVTGFIASSHVYDGDLPAIGRMLERAQEALANGALAGRP
ncbi:MAG: thymidylate synthase [Limisphaerales bacterium]